MEKYKVAVALSLGAGVNVFTGDGTCIAVLPESCAGLLRNKMRFVVHHNRAGDVVAYSFGNTVVFENPPLTRNEINEFVGNFKDLHDFSLDKIVFDYALRRHLRKIGLTPTRDLAVNIMAYNYVNKLGR